MSIIPQEDGFFRGNGKVAHAGQSEVKLMKRVMGGKRGRTYKAFTLTLHRCTPNFEHLENSVDDDATVDVPGMCL